MERDILVTCPYDKAHRIRQYKLTTHMIKCRKQNKDTNKITCPLTNSHVVDHDHLKDHVATCSKLATLVETNVTKEKPNITPAELDIVRLDENWDELPEIPTYNPMEQSAKKKVLRCVSGMTKSERKQFYVNEHIRISNLNAISGSNPVLSTVENSVQEAPLRPPRGIAQALRETEDAQCDSNKQNMQTDNHCTNMQTKSTESRETFHRRLYDGLLSDYDNEEDNVSVSDKKPHVATCEDNRKIKNILIQKLLESSNCNKDMVPDQSLNILTMTAKQCQDIIKEKNLPIYDQDCVKENKKGRNETNESFDVFDVNNSMRNSTLNEHSDHISAANTNIPLALFMNDTSVKKEEPLQIQNVNEKHEELNLKLEEVVKDLKDRFARLVNIQNTASEQKEEIAKRLEDLKTLKNFYTQIPTSYDPHYTGHVLNQFEEQLKNDSLLQKEQAFMENAQSLYNYGASGGSGDMLSVKDDENIKFHKLKTPDDFQRRG